MDAYITFIGPSAILLKQHVGRYLASQASVCPSSGGMCNLDATIILD